jgi:uncharacterized protein YceK
MFTCILCLVLLGLMLTGCGSNADQTVPTLEIPQEYIPTASELSQSTRATTVYYRDADGYIVPVTRTIPWQDGIAAATLGLMVQDEQNIQDAAAMGLEPVLPPERSQPGHRLQTGWRPFRSPARSTPARTRWRKARWFPPWSAR